METNQKLTLATALIAGFACSGAWAKDTAWYNGLRVGTISASYHFQQDDDEKNETHKGLYLQKEGWALGHYENSFNNPSTFVSYEFKKYNISVGGVSGYADEHNLGSINLRPFMSFNYEYKFVKVFLFGRKVIAAGFYYDF